MPPTNGIDEDEESELLPVLAQPECDPGRAADGRASSKTANRLQEVCFEPT
jgi:hypothetical protein